MSNEHDYIRPPSVPTGTPEEIVRDLLKTEGDRRRDAASRPLAP